MHPSTWNFSSISHQTKTRIHIPYQEPPSSLTYYSHSSSSCHQIDSFLKLVWYQHIISKSWIRLIASFLPSPHCQPLLVLQDILLSAQSRTLHYSSSFHITALAIHCKLLAHTHALLPFSSHFFSGQLQSEMAYLTTLLPLPAHQPSQKMPPRMASDAVSDALDINDITTSASSLS